MTSSKISEEFKRNCREMKKQEAINIRKGREIKRVLDNCKKSEYKYGFEKLNLFDLLKIIKSENKKVHVNDFLELFPETGPNGINVTRSHVFEALWIIIFVLRLDDLFSNTGGTRVFYNSVEKREEILRFIGTNNDGIKKFFNDSNVNESNKSGIVDIYFEDKKELSKKPEMGYACENKCPKEEKVKKKESESITTAYFYSSKYFHDDKKKGIGSLDIEKIYTEVIVKLSKKTLPEFKIGVLVNDIDVILKKQARSHKAAAELLKSDISYGTGTLNIYYQRLLNYLKKIGSENLDSDNPFSESSSFPEHISPRLHQDLFIKFTENRIKKGNNKFIWGAVPRSGKSFMIGGLIAEKQPQCVLLILGAVSETHDQFREDVFEKYKGSFPEDIYDIIDVKNSREVSKFSSLNPGKKNIIIVSQQQLWQKGEGENLRDYPQLNAILKTTDKMIFFDEIHQGASSNAEAQQKILNKYVVGESEALTFPFIMVTATFIKPMLKYELLGKEKSVVLQWTYDMMQNMKTIANEDTQQVILEEIKADRDIEIGREKGELFKKLLDDYQKSGYTLIQLQEQYEKEPELSIICPALTEPDKENLDPWVHKDGNIRHIFKIENLKAGQTQGLSKLLNYIKTSVYGIENPKAILAENNFNVLTRQHSQLWFLPTKLTNTKSEEGEVEPMMRYLLSEVMKDKFFRDNFCFVLMHSKNISKKKDDYIKILPGDLTDDLSGLDQPHKVNLEKTMTESGDKICFSTICLPPNQSSKKGDKECLREEECNAYNLNIKKKKSLIIFTGAKLRLGISLPCVDIAIHMDPIKSVDTIYQSMFRVLTPYPGKKKGFFIDLLKNRMIQFLYEYENQLNYNKSNNLPEKKLARLRNLIFSHDLNGIMLKQTNNSEYVQEYTNLVKVLGLENINTFQQKSEEFKINNETASTLINSVFNDSQITEFYKKFTLSKNKTSKQKKIITILRRGDGLLDTKERDTSKKSDKKEVSLKEKRDAVTIYFLNLIALFILFEDNNYHNCGERDVRSGIEKIMNVENIPSTDDIRELCNNISEGENNMLLLCYLSQTVLDGINENELQVITNEEKNFLLSELVKELNDKLDTFKIMIHNIQLNNMPELINIYCNIKNSFLMVKEKYHPENMSTEPCSDSFIKNEKILKIIRERLTVRTTEKEQHGEVFTPPELVCEMLDTLPKNVWTNKHLTWLDPANGIGNFPIIVYYKLMDGLKGVIKDDKERSKHIIEKMLFMVELNPVNVKVCKKIFKMIDPHVEPNIVKANFLTESSKWKRELGRDTFDIVMGNPPYNEGGIRSKIGTKKDKFSLWPNFIQSSINFITTNGYLLFITPNSWTEITSDISKIILSYQIEYVKCYTNVESQNLFNKQSGKIPLSYYLLRKSKTKNDTLIWDDHRNDFIKFNIYENNFIPNFNVSIFKKVLNRTKSNNLGNYFYGGQPKSKDIYNEKYSSPFLYPILNYSFNKFNLFYSNKCFRWHNNRPKLLLANFKMGFPILDTEGIIDTKSNNLYIIQNESFKITDLRKIQKIFLTPLAFLLINSLKTKMDFMSNRIFEVLPDVTQLDFDITDEKNLYKYFGFDKKDIEAIEEQIKSGEGNLTPKETKAILDFDIHTYLTASQIKTIKESIVKNCNKPSKTLKKKPSSKSSTKTRKSPPKSKSPSPPKSTKTVKKKKKLPIVGELKGGKKSKTLKKII